MEKALLFLSSPLGLHDIGKKLHCDILFFCDIYCDMKSNLIFSYKQKWGEHTYILILNDLNIRVLFKLE